MKDCDLRLVAINRRLAEKIAVVDKQSIIGMTDYDYLPSHMADAYKEDDLWVLETGKSIRGKVELVTSGKGWWIGHVPPRLL
ncbi:PAS domain-containing protein [Rubritalea tangerina]|uniref:PAS domain-containing protein n=1 Tax=Rubritalea tangerina TaxID=430798 RepID=UPI00361FD55E